MYNIIYKECQYKTLIQYLRKIGTFKYFLLQD
jgi:hypothetical protein